MSFDRESHSKRKEAAHKTLLKNLQVFQEKIENLADSALIKDEAYRQLSNDNAEMYRQMKQMIDVVSILPTIFQRTILNSEQVQRWVNPAPKNISQGRQKKMNSGNCLLCNCGQWIHKYHMNEHLKRNCHSENLLKLDLEKKSNLRKRNLNELLTLNSHLVALQYHRGHFKYAPKGENYPPVYCLQMAMKRLYIRRLGQRRE
jgi:hypothetical protein